VKSLGGRIFNIFGHNKEDVSFLLALERHEPTNWLLLIRFLDKDLVTNWDGRNGSSSANGTRNARSRRSHIPARHCRWPDSIPAFWSRTGQLAPNPSTVVQLQDDLCCASLSGRRPAHLFQSTACCFDGLFVCIELGQVKNLARADALKNVVPERFANIVPLQHVGQIVAPFKPNGIEISQSSLLPPRTGENGAS